MGALPWLSVLQVGLYPFIFGGVVKAILGAGIITLAWVVVGRRDKKKDQQL